MNNEMKKVLLNFIYQWSICLVINSDSWEHSTAENYLKGILDTSPFDESTEESRARRTISTYLQKIESVQFPPPISDPDQLGTLNTLEKEALDQDFIRQIGHLKRKISRFLKPKRLMDKTLDGISFLLVIEEYLNIHNKGETLTISGIVRRTEAEERKFLMNHIQDWVDFYFETSFLKRDLVETAVVKLLEMAGEDQRDFRFEVFKKSFSYFQEELRFKEEKEKALRLKFLLKSVENMKSAFPELTGLKRVQKILTDQSLKDKLFEFQEVHETVAEEALLEERTKGKKQVDFLREKMQIQDSNFLYLQEQCDQLKEDNQQWKARFSKLEGEYQNIRIKLNAQKEELSKLREINSGKKNSSVQLGILIQTNTELKEENNLLREQVLNTKMLRKNKKLTHFLRKMEAANQQTSRGDMLKHVEQTMLKENNLLRNHINELEEGKKDGQNNGRRMSLHQPTMQNR